MGRAFDFSSSLRDRACRSALVDACRRTLSTPRCDSGPEVLRRAFCGTAIPAHPAGADGVSTFPLLRAKQLPFGVDHGHLIICQDQMPAAELAHGGEQLLSAAVQLASALFAVR